VQGCRIAQGAERSGHLPSGSGVGESIAGGGGFDDLAGEGEPVGDGLQSRVSVKVMVQPPKASFLVSGPATLADFGSGVQPFVSCSSRGSDRAKERLVRYWLTDARQHLAAYRTMVPAVGRSEMHGRRRSVS
jgi:hypothetical protein